MTAPEFGGTFFDVARCMGAKMYWGARGAIRYDRYAKKRTLEIYPDRQGFTADDTTDKPAFVDFINNELIPTLEEKVRLYSTQRIKLESADGKFKALAEDRNSGGYLYVGAWAV